MRRTSCWGAQFIVHAPPADGTNATLITLAIDTGPLGDNDPTRPIANIFLDDSAPAPPLTFPVATAAAAAPAVSAVDSRTMAAPVQNRTLYFSEAVSGPSDPASPTTFFLTQEGDQPVAFYPFETPPIVVRQGDVEDWTVQNRAGEVHVFHIHQLHFTVLEAEGILYDLWVIDQFLDTLVIPFWNGTGLYPAYTIRLDFDGADVGEFVTHCHIAGHEDEGMTTAVRVVPADYIDE